MTFTTKVKQTNANVNWIFPPYTSCIGISQRTLTTSESDSVLNIDGLRKHIYV